MKPHRILPVLFAFVFALLAAVPAHASAEGSNLGKAVTGLEQSLTFQGQSPVLAGKPMILEFWATWCPPCRKSIPHLNEVYNKYKDRGLVVVGVTNEKPEVIAEFVKKTPMHYTVAYDVGGKLSASFGIKGIPHAMLVDRTGKIVWEGHPMKLKDADIEKLLSP